MKLLLILFFCSNIWAMDDENLRQKWLGRVQLTDRHGSYQDAESLRAPAGTWQSLFTVVLSEEKHCVLAKIPVKARDGELKVVQRKLNEPCANSWESAAIWHQVKLRSIQFGTDNDEVKLWWANEDGRIYSLTSKVPTIKGVFFYPPNTEESSVKVELVGKLNDVFPANPCSFDEGTCQLCRFGAYRVKGATPEFYCGIDRCGESNFPACERGTRWQKSRGPYSCRGNTDHVFCAEGLRIECLGEVAFCR